MVKLLFVWKTTDLLEYLSFHRSFPVKTFFTYLSSIVTL